MKKLLSLFLVFLALGACQKEAETPGTFVDKEYILRNVPENIHITLGFEGKSNRFFGKSAVNRYFGMYTLNGNDLTFSPAGSTMMMGPQEQMEAEQKYLAQLPKVKSFKLDGKKLTLYTSDDQELVYEEMIDLDSENVSANNRYTKKAMQNRKENMEDSK